MIKPEQIAGFYEVLKHGSKAFNLVLEVGEYTSKCYHSFKDTKQKSRDRAKQSHHTHKRQSKPYKPHLKKVYVRSAYDTDQVRRYDRQQARKVALSAFKNKTACLIHPGQKFRLDPTSIHKSYVVTIAQVEWDCPDDRALRSIREALKSEEGSENLRFEFRELRDRRRCYVFCR
ncbi:unnamed protein product [Aspergillus oryzae]|nr:unnamed protein product [Aspergillus oryzae]